ncbi:MAG TPA: hypothetical protein VF577_07715 [Allosphingosinicella sp.]|jgi:hypothetical protein
MVTAVPKFFFHIHDDIFVRDEEGLELSDVAAARATAVASARALMCDQVTNGQLNLGHRIEVEDDAGEPVLMLPFGDAVEIRS